MPTAAMPEQATAVLAPEDRGTAFATAPGWSDAGVSSITAAGGGRCARYCRRCPRRLPLPAARLAVRARRAEAAAPPPPAMDPMLHDIYSKETSSHLTEIREYLRKRSGQPAPHDLPESVYRAIHTLSGSSKMAEARHGIRITEPLNQVMRKVFDSGHRSVRPWACDVGRCGARHRQRGIAYQRVHRVLLGSAFAAQRGCTSVEAELDAEIALDAADAIDISASAMEPDAEAAPEQIGRCIGSTIAPAARRHAPRRAEVMRPAGQRRRRRIRSRDRQHLQRRGDRAARGGGNFADRLEPRSQGQGTGC